MTSNDGESRPSHTAEDIARPEPPADVPVLPGTPAAPFTPAVPPEPSAARVTRTRISGTWVAVIIAMIILVFLLIFILQNLASATVFYLGVAGTLPLGVALLLAAVGGALLVALIGTARILQLRRLAGPRAARRDSGT